MKKKPNAPASMRTNPDAHRGQWHRKPITQVQPNRKAQQRRTFCRMKGKDDGAVFMSAAS